MTSDRDIYATALQLIKRYGVEGAAFHAAQKADEMFEQGAMAGMRVWQHILAAIDVLAAEQPPKRSSLH